MGSEDTFPRQYARTRRFSLGEPRTFTISDDGGTVLFLRTRGGADPLTCLWRLDVADGQENLLADPLVLLGGEDPGDLPPAERARRERQREQADGITAYATDRGMGTIVFTLSGRVFTCNVSSGVSKSLIAAPGAYDARLSPDGRHVAYVRDRRLRLVGADGDGDDRVLVGEDDDTISWGTADFTAAEEFNRHRGYWWAPDSSRLLAARVDNGPVALWYIADPAHPERAPIPHRYPAAGTANAVVSLALFDIESGARTDVTGWDAAAFPYLLEVVWSEGGPLVAVVLNRAQDHMLTLRIDADTGVAMLAHEARDPAWLELMPGTPRWLPDGRMVQAAETRGGPFGSTVLTLDGRTLAVPDGWQVRRLVDASTERLVFLTTAGESTQTAVAVLDLAGGAAPPAPRLLSRGGVADASARGDVAVIRDASLDHDGGIFSIVRVSSGEHLGTISSLAEIPLVKARPHLQALGSRACNVAVLFPTGFDEESQLKLPVLMDPYGGPHAQRVVASRNAYATSQWFADQGFAVVVVDGRGTPGPGPSWEKAVHRDLAAPILEDQIDALHAAAERFPALDLTRVAIRGWSFGGYLAALAVLRRPDVFHTAVAGAPVTDWRLYDTGYTERYLGNPSLDPEPYDRCSLLAEAHALTRPLMLIHGLADDNVVCAHTLLFSSALLAAGRAHEVLPLSGVTHMTPQETVAENLLLLQVAFMKRTLDL